MSSSTETAAALAAAQSKLTAASDRILALSEQESALSNALGEALASDDAELASELKAKRALVRDALDDLLYGRNALAQRADAAERAHREAAHAEHVKTLKAQAARVLSAAASFEKALSIITQARTEFVAAGNVLSRTAGDARYSTETLADDFIQRRLYGRQNPEFDKPVPALLQHVEAL